MVPGGRAANVSRARAPKGPPRRSRSRPRKARAQEGHRLYFTTRSHLLPGAPEAGTPAIYRVDTETHELAYVGPVEAGDQVGENPRGVFDHEGTAISPNGRFLVFRSAAAGLDPLSGSDNGDTAQDYLYDDAERSLSCASCPADGSAPRGGRGEGDRNRSRTGAGH